VNCITDIELTINLDQIKLISALNNEFLTLLCGNFEKAEVINDSSNTIQRFASGSQNIKSINWLKQTSDDSDLDLTKDSGVDFEMSSMHSTIIVSCRMDISTKVSRSILIPYPLRIYFKNHFFVLGKDRNC